MNNKNTGMIATIATALLCGCPGLLLCIFGVLSAAGIMPYTTEVNGVTNSGTVPSSIGFVMLCLSLVFILIPIVVGFITLRKKPEATVAINEPLPPAS